MTLSRTWYTSQNYAVPDLTTAARAAKALAWSIAASLTGNAVGTNGVSGALPAGAKWTVEGSCDSVAANMVGTDSWLLTAYDNTKLVNATAGNPHSWIVLKSPTALGSIRLLIALDQASAGTILMVCSYAAFSGGTTTANPTTTTGFGITGAAGTPSALQVHDNTATQYRIHYSMDANGGFYLAWGKAGAGFLNGFMAGNIAVGPTTGDNYPFITGFNYINSGIGVPQATSTFVAGCRNYNNTIGGCAESTACIMRLMSTGSQTLGALVTVTNEVDGSVQGVPVWVVISSGTAKMFKGVFPDMYEVGTPAAVGAQDPSSGQIQHLQLGHYRLPFDVAISM